MKQAKWPLRVDPSRSGVRARRSGIGAQQAFSVCSRRVSDAPFPVVHGAIIEPLESTPNSHSNRMVRTPDLHDVTSIRQHPSLTH
jgi:hypothetical protein